LADKEMFLDPDPFLRTKTKVFDLLAPRVRYHA
jgi:hypothetical protein